MSDEQAIERVRAYVEAPYELHDESQAQWRADLRTLLRLATPPVTGEVGELVERLRGVAYDAYDKCIVGISAEGCHEAAAMLERYAAENARLSKCASCGEPLSRDCQTCRRDWAS